jgi:hypothetical protein
MPKKIKYITGPLYLSSILFVLAILFMVMLLYQDGSWRILLSPWESSDRLDLFLRLSLIFSLILSIGFIIIPIIVASALKERKRWAWTAGWLLTCLYLLSGFFPLGISMLVGLLDKEVKEFFADEKGLSTVSDPLLKKRSQ